MDQSLRKRNAEASKPKKLKHKKSKHTAKVNIINTIKFYKYYQTLLNRPKLDSIYLIFKMFKSIYSNVIT